MSRTQRLLDLIQILRRHRYPIPGSALAAELGVSLRTLYRYIGVLQEQGAEIAGETGVGYVLRPGFMLPPLMFSEDEIEALALGSRWVSQRGDDRLGSAARNALAKIASVIPDSLREALESSTLLAGPGESIPNGYWQLPLIRRAIRGGRKLDIIYRDLKDTKSCRTIWPFAIGFFDRAHVVVTWCELRQTFRHFRVDRITELRLSEQRYPRKRQALLKEWQLAEEIPSP